MTTHLTEFRQPFKPPPTGSRTHAGTLTRLLSYTAAPTQLHVLSRLFDDAVNIEGLQKAAVMDAWKVVSNALVMSCSSYGSCPIGEKENRVFWIQSKSVPFRCFRQNLALVYNDSCTTANYQQKPPSQISKDVKLAGDLDKRVGQAAAWIGLTNLVLGDSRPMTAEEHKLAAEALWTEVERE